MQGHNLVLLWHGTLDAAVGCTVVVTQRGLATRHGWDGRSTFTHQHHIYQDPEERPGRLEDELVPLNSSYRIRILHTSWSGKRPFEYLYAIPCANYQDIFPNTFPLWVDLMQTFLLSVLFVRAVVVLGQQGQQNNNTQCFFPGGKVHEKGIACGSGAASSCCEPSQTCLSNGLCWNPASNQVARVSCTDKTWNSDLCPRWCTAEQRDSASELRQCSGSTNDWICGSRTDDCSRNFTVPMGQIRDERPFSQNGILQADTCVADSSSSGSGGSSGWSGRGPPPFVTAGRAATATATVTTTASPDGTGLATALAAATAAGREEAGDSGKKLATTVGLGVGLGLGLPLTCALIGSLFLCRRARQEAAAARAELAELRDNFQRQEPEYSRPKPDENHLLHPSVFSSPTPSPMHQRLPPLYGAMAEDKPQVFEAPHTTAIHQLPGTADEMAYLVEAPSSPHMPPSILNSATSHHPSPISVHSRPFHRAETPR
ncbi:hypothetical protein RB595_005956 [Gaeumannomyces hyphopodioides]